MDAITKSFHWADYFIFISSLVIATGIGIFYTWKDKDKQTTSDFLLGGRKMGLLPVTLSLAATLSSGGLQMGIPAEVFYNGTMWIYIWVPNAFVFIFIARYVIPVYHDLQITSVYEYLEMRFNRGIRIVGCIIFVIQTLLNMALTLYAPALALNQVMGIDMLVSIVLIGLVCTFYTAIGGLKAVMWTDVFQTLVIFVGLISLIVLATIDAGGISVVYETASKAGKVELDNFNPSPFERHTFWTLFIGGFTTTLGIYGTNQSMVQRFVSMEKIKGAQTSLYLQLIGSFISMVILTFMGLVLFAKYGETNPVPCLINKPDQLVPYLVMDVLGNMYGIPGLYVACIFSASLSTVSSGINSLALVFIHDFCKPIYKYHKQRDIEEKRATLYAKVIAMFFGLLTILLAFIYQYLGSLIVQMGLSVTGIVGGPLLSMFVLGLFFPCVNSLSVVVGIIISTILTLWLGIGSMLNANGPPPAVCDVNVTSNFTEFLTTTVSYNTTFQTDSEKSDLEMFYSISYLLYGTFAVLVSLIIAIIVSCATGGTQDNPVESRLLSPLYHRIASLSMTYQIPATKDCREKRTESIETICNGELNEKHVNGYDNKVVIENGTTV